MKNSKALVAEPLNQKDFVAAVLAAELVELESRLERAGRVGLGLSAQRRLAYLRRTFSVPSAATETSRLDSHAKLNPAQAPLAVLPAKSQHHAGLVQQAHQPAPLLGREAQQAIVKQNFVLNFPYNYITLLFKVCASIVSIIIVIDLAYICLFGRPEKIMSIPKGIYQGLVYGWDTPCYDWYRCND